MESGGLGRVEASGVEALAELNSYGADIASADAGGLADEAPDRTAEETQRAADATATPEVLPARVEPQAVFRPVASPARAGAGRRRPSTSPSRRSEAGQPPAPPTSPAQALDGTSSPITPSKPRSLPMASTAEGTETPEMKPTQLRHQEQPQSSQQGSQPQGRLAAAPGLFAPGEKLTRFPGKAVIIASIGGSRLLNDAETATRQDKLLKSMGFIVAVPSSGAVRSQESKGEGGEAKKAQPAVAEVAARGNALTGPPKKVGRQMSEKDEFAMLVKQVTRGQVLERPPTPQLGPARSPPWPPPLGPRAALREGPQWLGVV